MNINATLLVQAINFWIAYLLFRFIFLKPAYQSIRQEQQDQQRWEGMVLDDKNRLESVRQQRVARWIACQQDCKKYVPEHLSRVEIFRGIVPSLTAVVPSLKELNGMAKRIAQTIVTRMGER